MTIKMTMKFVITAISLGVAPMTAITSATVAYAQVPTIDPAAIARMQMIINEQKMQLQQQIQQNLKLDDQTLKMIQQIQMLEQQIAALKNGLTLADLGLDPASLLRDILPDFSDLSGSLHAAKAGNWSGVLTNTTQIAGRSVTDYVSDTFSSAGIDKAEVDALANSDNPSVARIGNQANVNAFLSVAAESSSQAARESLTRIASLLERAGDTQNLKEAIDLNTFVTGELGIALANIWAMEAVQTIGMGEGGVMDAATLADEEKYLRIRLEDNQ